jgi:Tfp pilus assembly protein PilX
MNTQIPKTQKSFALITVLVITLLLLMIVSIYVTVAIFETKITRNQVFDAKSFYVAEAGYNHALNTINLAPGLIPDGTQVNGSLDSMDYTCSIDLESELEEQLKIYAITCTVNDAVTGARKKITALVQIQTFAKYAYYTNQELSATGSTVWFVGIPQLTDILGRKAWVSPDQESGATIHTNGRFSFYGNPQFWAKVESVNQYAQFYDTITGGTYVLDADTHPPGAIPVFKKTFARNADSIPFPSNINSIDDAPASEVITAPAGATVTLNGTNVTINSTNYNLSDIKVIKSSGNLDVSGTLDGTLTIASGGKIFVIDNLVYANRSPASDDILGLFAKSDIVVKNNQNTSPGVGKNISIDGSVLSLTKFTIYPYSGGTFDNPTGRKPCATLRVSGGIIQKVRGIMGHFSLSTGCQDGYVKDYRYDERLLTTPPPYFPTTGEPQIISWKEEIIE